MNYPFYLVHFDLVTIAGTHYEYPHGSGEGCFAAYGVGTPFKPMVETQQPSSGYVDDFFCF